MQVILYHYKFNYKSYTKTTMYKDINYYPSTEYRVPNNYYSYAAKSKPSDFGLAYRYAAGDIIETIHNDNPNYLPHEETYDYDNLTATTYKDLAITIKNQLELGEKELLDNLYKKSEKIVIYFISK